MRWALAVPRLEAQLGPSSGLGTNSAGGCSSGQVAKPVLVVLQEDKGAWPTQHLALRVKEADIEAAATALQKQGVAVKGPVYHAWMPAKSVYFSDPDGHELELCAPVEKA